MSDFAKKTVWTTATQLVVFVFSLVSSVVISRYLGPQGRGEYTLAMTAPSFIVLLLNSGLGNAAVYLVGSGAVKISTAMGSNLALWVIHSVVGLIAGGLTIQFGAETFFRGVPVLYLWLSMLTIPALFYLTFILPVFLGNENFKTYNFFQLIRPVLFVAGIAVILLLLKMSPAILLVLENIVMLLVCIVMHRAVYTHTGKIQWRIDPDYSRKAIKYGLSLYLGSLLLFANSNVLYLILNLYFAASAVGIYSVAITISDKMMLLADSVSTVLYANVSTMSDANMRILKTVLVFKVTVLLAGTGALLLALISRPLIILLFTSEFKEAIPCLRILLLGSVAGAGYRVLAGAIKGMGAPMLQSNIYLLGFVINVLFALKLSGAYGLAGFAWAVVISQSVMCLAAIVYLERKNEVKVSDFFIFQGYEIDRCRRLLKGIMA